MHTRGHPRKKGTTHAIEAASRLLVRWRCSPCSGSRSPSCGSDDSDESAGGRPASRSSRPATAPPDNAKKGGTLNVITAGDVDYIDPGAAYYQFTYMVDLGHAAGAVRLAAGRRRRTRSPTWPTASRRSLTTTRRVTFKIKPGIKYSPPLGGGTGVDRRHLGRLQVRDRARAPAGRGERLRRRLLRLDSMGFKQAAGGGQEGPDRRPGHQRHQDARRPDDRLQADKPHGADASRRRCRCRSALRCRRSTRRSSTPRTPPRYGEHQLAHRPLLIGSTAATATARQGDHHGPEPELGRRRTDYRPAYLDKIDFQEGFTDAISAARRSSPASDQVNGDFSSEPRDPEARRHPVPGPDAADPVGRQPLRGDEHAEAAVRRHQRPQGGGRRRGPRGDDRDPRRPAGRARSPPTSSRRAFPGSRRPAAPHGPDLDFLKNPKGDPSLAESYMKKAGFESGKCEGRLRRSAWSATTRRPAATPPRSSRTS